MGTFRNDEIPSSPVLRRDESVIHVIILCIILGAMAKFELVFTSFRCTGFIPDLVLG